MAAISAYGQNARKVDPLICPDCGGQMKIIEFIEGDQSMQINRNYPRRAFGKSRFRERRPHPLSAFHLIPVLWITPLLISYASEIASPNPCFLKEPRANYVSGLLCFLSIFSAIWERVIEKQNSYQLNKDANL